MTSNVEQRDPWAERLSEYVDGELSRRERRALEAHMAHCSGCRAVVWELQQILRRAEQLRTESEPVGDLWPAIAERLTPRTDSAQRPWLWMLTPARPTLAAIATALACLLAWIALPSLHRAPRPEQPAPSARVATTVAAPSPAIGAPARETPPPASPARPRPRPGRLAAREAPDQEYVRAAARLEREARDGLTLDPRLLEVLDDNLGTINAAIQSYRAALAAEPGNADIRDRLVEARRRKLAILEQAVSLASLGTN